MYPSSSFHVRVELGGKQALAGPTSCEEEHTKHFRMMLVSVVPLAHQIEQAMNMANGVPTI